MAIRGWRLREIAEVELSTETEVKLQPMRSIGIGLFGLGLVIAVVIALQVRTNQVLHSEMKAMRAEREAALQEAREAAAARAAVAQAAAAARRAEDREWEKLREDIARLENEMKKISLAQAAQGGADSAIPVDLIPAKDWQNAGDESPAAAMETFYWAALHSELDVLAAGILFPEDDAARVSEWFSNQPENIRQDYGTPEKLLGHLMSDDSSTLSGMQVLEQRDVGDGDVMVRIRFGTTDGEIDAVDYLVRPTAQGWRLVLSADTLEHSSRLLPPPN